MNEALVAWLITAPDAPDERLTLVDFLRRSRLACAGGLLWRRAGGIRSWPMADYDAIGTLCAGLFAEIG